MGSAAIPLGYKPPQLDQYSATDALKSRMGLQAMAQAAQLNDARIQEEQLKAQKARQLQADNEILRTGMADPSIKGDIKKLIPWAAQQKLQPETIQALQKHDAELDDKLSQTKDRDLKNLQGHLAIVGDHLSAVLNAPPEQRKALGLAAIKDLEEKGVVKPGEIDPSILDDEATLRFHADATAGAKASADREAARRAAKTNEADLAEKAQKLSGEQRTDTAGILAAAAERGPAEYIKARAQIQDPKLRDSFPDVPEGAQPLTPLDTDFVENVRSIGLKAHEQATVASTKALRQETAQRDAETALWRGATADERERHDRVSEEIQRTRAARERGQTANSHAVDLRGWQRELAKVKEEEDDIATTRANLENVIASGGKIDEKGKPVKVASDDDKAAAAALVERSRSQYESLTKKLKRVTADKNDLGELLGQEIGVKTSDVHRALDADLKRVGAIGKPTDKPNPPAAAPPAQAKPAPQAQAAPRQGQRFSNGKVTVMWNGKQYIDEATGKPAQF